MSTSDTEFITFFISTDVVQGEKISKDAFVEAMRRWVDSRNATYEWKHDGVQVTVESQHITTDSAGPLDILTEGGTNADRL